MVSKYNWVSQLVDILKLIDYADLPESTDYKHIKLKIPIILKEYLKNNDVCSLQTSKFNAHYYKEIEWVREKLNSSWKTNTY